jgi:hypothetical protein
MVLTAMLVPGIEAARNVMHPASLQSAAIPVQVAT